MRPRPARRQRTTESLQRGGRSGNAPSKAAGLPARAALPSAARVWLVRELRFAILVVAAAAAVVVAASSSASQAAAPAASCVEPAQPAWIDYADKWVPFRRLFFRPGLAVALAHTAPAADARSGGAQVAYWDMSLKAAVGTPSHPADSSTVTHAVALLAAAAVTVTACDAPIVALNELYGSRLRSPWSRTNARYRANVLELVRALAQRGVQPHVFISRAPPPAERRRTGGGRSPRPRRSCARSTFPARRFRPSGRPVRRSTSASSSGGRSGTSRRSVSRAAALDSRWASIRAGAAAAVSAPRAGSASSSAQG